MNKLWLFILVGGILFSCKKEKLIIQQSDIVSDVIVDSVCANILGYPSDTVYTLYICNAFYPIQDGVNDDFRPIGTGDWKSYYFEIRNKKNELLFKTDDPLRTWNGQVNGGNYVVPQDVYAYYVEIRTGCPDMVHKYRGGVAVIK